MSSIHASDGKVSVLPFPASKSHSQLREAVNGYLPGFLMLGIVIAFALLALKQQEAPRAIAANAPAEQFSSGRAVAHIEAISRAPHEIGSAEHAAVRDYIVRELTGLGVSPEVQKTTFVSLRTGSPEAATIENVVARLRGTNNSKAVLLVSHYDSVPTSPGASDDGAGVANLLETLRALKSQAPLKNDVIVLFTDGEEVGLLGAQAFVKEHPWAQDAGVVLNFEARGSSGASIMFETSNGNGRLIDELARAPYPVGNSLSYDIYKLLPNDTDFTVLRDSGLPGLNFAFIKGLTHYHTQLDSIANVDQRSLQHHGANALALTRQFGSLDLNEQKKRDAVYFNIPGSILIHYSSTWIIPLAVLVTIVFILMLVYGFRRKHFTPGGVALGFCACLLNVVIVGTVVFGAWFVISLTTSAYSEMPFGDTYNSALYLVGFSALTITLVLAVFVLFRKKTASENLLAGGLLCWLILLLLSAVFLPGGSYLFTWPLLFSLLGLTASFLLKERALSGDPRLALKLALVFSICSVPALVLLMPLISQIFTALTVQLSFVPMIFAVLLLWLLTPVLDQLTRRRKWLLSAVTLAIGFLFIGAAGLTAGFDKNHPQPYHLIYGLDADVGKAIWASASGTQNKWTAQFFSGGVQREQLGQYYYKNPRYFLVAPAPFLTLPAPEVTLINDQKVDGGSRLLKLRIVAPANDTSVFINVSADAKTRQARLNGREIDGSGANSSFGFGSDWGLRYYAPELTGIDLDLELESAVPVKVQVVGLSRGLPDIPNTRGRNRPERLMPVPYLLGDSTMVARTFSFN